MKARKILYIIFFLLVINEAVFTAEKGIRSENEKIRNELFKICFEFFDLSQGMITMLDTPCIIKELTEKYGDKLIPYIREFLYLDFDNLSPEDFPEDVGKHIKKEYIDKSCTLIVPYILSHIKTKKSIKLLDEILSDDKFIGLHHDSVIALGKIGTKETLPVLVKYFKKRGAINHVQKYLGEIGGKRVVELLINKLDPHDRYCFFITYELEKITGEKIGIIEVRGTKGEDEDPKVIEYRSKIIKKWKEWWEKNKDKYPEQIK